MSGYIYQNQTELDFRLENGAIVEAKYHQEPLSDKQQNLLESFPAEFRHIIHNDKDLKMLLSSL